MMNAHVAAMPPFTSADPLTIKARRDIIDLCDREKVASVGWWAYQNGGSEIMGDLIRANPHYKYYHGEVALMKEQGANIAKEIEDTEVAVILGAGDAFSVKEKEILKNLPNLKKVVLIDVSSSFNQSAKSQVQEFIKENELTVDIDTINNDFFKLSKRDLAKIQSGGVTSLFASGGTLLNSPGEFTDGRPEGRVKSAFKHVGNILNFGEANRNSFVMSHKLPPREKTEAFDEYCFKDPEAPKANVEYWLAHCFSYMLQKADPGHDFNQDVFPDGYSPEAVLDLFEHRYSYEDDATNSRNGLAVKTPFRLQIPTANGTDVWTKEFRRGEPFYFFNSVNAPQHWLDQMGRTADSTRPIETVKSFTAGDNSVLVMRPQTPALAA